MNHLVYQSLFKWIFIISVLVMGFTYYYKDNFPEPNTYDMNLLHDPLQTPTSREPFSTEVHHERYLIKPKFNYELTGVVVTYNDSNGLTDIWHHDIWKDFINVRDLCVIWGSNVRSGIYKNISFSSDSWTCWVYWRDNTTQNIFQNSALSNNHLLTDDKVIKARLMTAEKGDLVHFKGVLAEYKNEASDFTRGTSTIRTDTGNGACETVYIDEFDILKKANPVLRTVFECAKWMVIISLIGFFIMFLKTPFKVNK